MTVSMDLVSLIPLSSSHILSWNLRSKVQAINYDLSLLPLNFSIFVNALSFPFLLFPSFSISIISIYQWNALRRLCTCSSFDLWRMHSDPMRPGEPNGAPIHHIWQLDIPFHRRYEFSSTLYGTMHLLYTVIYRDNIYESCILLTLFKVWY